MVIADVKAAKDIRSNTLWWKRIVQNGFLQDCICKQLWQNCFLHVFAPLTLPPVMISKTTNFQTSWLKKELSHTEFRLKLTPTFSHTI